MKTGGEGVGGGGMGRRGIKIGALDCGLLENLSGNMRIHP